MRQIYNKSAALISRQENVSLCTRQSAQPGPVPAVLHRYGRHARGLETLQVCVCGCVLNSSDSLFIYWCVYSHALCVSRQVCVPQLAVDGGWKHGPLLHLSQALRAPGLAVRRRDVDASGHQL